MQPLAEFPRDARRRVCAVLTDIDDTITTDGRLTAAAYGALERLHDAGFLVVPVTGRPAGWCDHIARMWPVSAVVGENGAFAFRHDPAARRLQRRFLLDRAARAAGRRRLEAVRDRILSTVPGTALASDQPYREADLAIDVREDVAPLDGAAIDRVVAIAHDGGATAKVSSIHVNIYFGDYDKLTMARRLLAEDFGLDTDRDRDRCVFVGDSPNDAPMFQFFANGIGVANVIDWADRMEALPAYVTESRSGAGFVEVAECLLSARGGDP